VTPYTPPLHPPRLPTRRSSDLTAGQRFRIYMAASTIGYWDQRVQVYAPDGTKLADTNAQAGSRWYVDNAQPGVYKVIDAPNTDRSDTHTSQLQPLSDLEFRALI